MSRCLGREKKDATAVVWRRSSCFVGMQKTRNETVVKLPVSHLLCVCVLVWVVLCGMLSRLRSYFEYMSKAFFHKLPTVLCKIVGVYQIGYHNKNTGKRQMDQVSKKKRFRVSRAYTHHNKGNIVRAHNAFEDCWHWSSRRHVDVCAITT